jgi:pimeloyl-ACP methyl ester carboxylesterase
VSDPRPLLSDNAMWEAFGTRALNRAVYGGADFGECTTTIERVGDDGGLDDWHREWAATAERVESLADDSAAAGHPVSAREAYLRAATYHFMSYYSLFGEPVDERLREAFERETRAFEKAAALLDPPVQVLEIPFEDGSMPAFLATVDDSGEARPTIVQTNGYDSNIREMYFSHAPAARRRGWNWLGFDGPGQGRNLIRDGLHIRPDWENVVRPALDFALELPEVDAERAVLVGWSFGGLLAPRAAAFEDRLAALVADPGQWDQRDNVVGRLPLSDAEKASFPDGVDPEKLRPMEEWLRSKDANPMLRWTVLQRGLWVNGKSNLFDYFADMCRYELSPVAEQISCPTLLTAAEGDPLAASASKLYDALRVEPKALVRFTLAEGSGGHCEGLARTLYHQRVFDWLDEVVAS